MPRKSFSSNGGPNAEDRAIDQWAEVFVEKLESLSSDAKWQQPWFSDSAMRWPINMSARPYSNQNAIYLMLLAEKNKYEMPVWGTFQRFTSLNYQTDAKQGPIPLRDKDGNDMLRVMINKGEKSASVFLTSYTVVDKETREKIPYETYREMEAEEKARYNVYPKQHVYQVFNVSQTNLKEARPELWNKLMQQSNAAKHERDMSRSEFPVFDKMVDEQRWVCPINVGNGDASFYSISRDAITLPERKFFKDDESFIGTLSHEAMHSLGSAERFNRFNPPGGFDEKARAKEEMIAELGAALVAQREGCRHYTKTDSLPYIKSWIDSIKEEPRFILNVMNDVKKSANVLIEKIDELKTEMVEGVSRTAENNDTQAKTETEKSNSEVVAAKNASEPPQEEQEEHVHRGFHR